MSAFISRDSLFLASIRAVASCDCGEVDVGVVNAVEDVGEDGRREGEADVDKLRVAVAGILDSGEICIAHSAAGRRELASEADQRIALDVAGRLAIADV